MSRKSEDSFPPQESHGETSSEPSKRKRIRKGTPHGALLSQSKKV